MSVQQDQPLFDLPEVFDNSGGWGPVGALDKFQNLPYQQFNKADKIGKVADWIGITQFNERFRREGRYGNPYTSGTIGSQYDYVHDEEDATFQLVDTSKPQRTNMQKSGRMRQQQQFYRKLVQKENERRNQSNYGQNQRIKRSIAKEQQRAFKQWQRRGGGTRGRGRGGQGYGRWDQRNQKQLTASIAVRAEWQVLEEMDFPRLAKLNLPNIEPGQDINGHRYGQLYYYDKAFDRVTVRTEKPLQRCGGTFYNLTTTEDPVIQKLAQESVGNVFATDMILATLMACTRSVYSWDVIAYRVGDKLFFDKRDTGGFSNPVDALTVSETSPDAPNSDDTTSINHPRNLATEALYINQNFRRMVLKRNEEPFKYDNPRLPFDEGDTDTDSCVAYKYRLWHLGRKADGTEVRLVCRTEHDGVTLGPNGETQMLTIKAFNEWDSRMASGVDWRSKLDTQKGAVLATELQNNSCKLAKWTLQALLAGSDQIKFGYVSRLSIRNSASHVILGTQQYKPTEFATNITLNLDNAWGILRCIIDHCMNQPPGKYLLLKDPNKQAVRLYSLPEGTFESSTEEESSSSGEENFDDDV
ncbi:eukaryotic translation initiation factor 3 subunit D family protein [Onchocerca flexuosa]|uniref:Eukaryotic translation initiation factor 3 subunit D n=1 Tax=Onchocerca flexuosa TaxID=387005 RepID=A0A238BSA9_9BILA|nr:eukaryotic translation initiation factor 3 subunit D family protein [Onchocerca flexuosa]